MVSTVLASEYGTWTYKSFAMELNLHQCTGVCVPVDIETISLIIFSLCIQKASGADGLLVYQNLSSYGKQAC